MTGRRGRLTKLEAKRPVPEGIKVIITRQIVGHGPDGQPVLLRVVRKEFTVYPAGTK